MIRQKRTLIIFGAVLIILIAVLVLINQKPDLGSSDPSDDNIIEIEPVIELISADIKEIEIINQNTSLLLIPELVSEGDSEKITWTLADENSSFYDKERLTDLVNSILLLNAEREIETSAENIERFGLGNPQIEINYHLKDNTSKKVLIGDTLASGTSEYVMLEGSGRVCSVSTSVSAKLQENNLYWLDNNLPVNFLYNDLISFSMQRSRDNIKMEVDCEFVGDPEDSQTNALSFKVVSPLYKEGDANSMGNLVSQITSISAADFVELNPADISIYGLDSPQYVFELATKNSKLTLKIGDIAESGRLYAVSDQVDAVFTVETSTLTALDTPLVDLVDPFVCLYNIGRVSKIEADIYGTVFETEIELEMGQSTSDEEAAFFLNGKDAKIFSQTNTNLYTKFYQSIIGITLAGIDTTDVPEPGVVDNAKAKLVFYLEKDTDSGDPARTETVEFVERDAYTDYVFIDGKYTGFYINREAAFTSDQKNSEGIITAYKMLEYSILNSVDGVFNTEEGYQID